MRRTASQGQPASVQYQTRGSDDRGGTDAEVDIAARGDDAPTATAPTTTTALSACDTNSPREKPRSCSAVQIDSPR